MTEDEARVFLAREYEAQGWNADAVRYRPIEDLSSDDCRSIRATIAAVADSERRIVEWLRSTAAPLSVMGNRKHILEALADAISRGEHRKEGADG